MGAVLDVLVKTVQALLSAAFYAYFIQTKRKGLFIAEFGVAVALSVALCNLLNISIVIRGPMNMVLGFALVLVFGKIPKTIELLYYLMAQALMFLFELPFDFGFISFFSGICIHGRSASNGDSWNKYQFYGTCSTGSCDSILGVQQVSAEKNRPNNALFHSVSSPSRWVDDLFHGHDTDLFTELWHDADFGVSDSVGELADGCAVAANI